MSAHPSVHMSGCECMYECMYVRLHARTSSAPSLSSLRACSLGSFTSPEEGFGRVEKWKMERTRQGGLRGRNGRSGWERKGEECGSREYNGVDPRGYWRGQRCNKVV